MLVYYSCLWCIVPFFVSLTGFACVFWGARVCVCVFVFAFVLCLVCFFLFSALLRCVVLFACWFNVSFCVLRVCVVFLFCLLVCSC